jgi:hypothetical protein
MYEGGIKSKKDVATIMGQKYKKAWNHHIQVAVYKVDGKEVFNDWTTLTTPFVIEINPGTHDLTIRAGYGNMRSYTYHPKPPTIRVNVEAGQVYQIDSQFMRIANGGTGANYSLRHIGNIEEYEDYLAKHPEYEYGSLLPTLRRTQGTSYSPRPLYFPRELFLDYASPSPNPR